MQRTVSIKITTPEGFLDYLKTCNEIYNKYIEWCFDNKTYNKKKAHEELYRLYRELYPNIPSAMIQTIRDTALESVKSLKFKFKPTKKPYSAIRYDSRTIALRGDLLYLTWSGKRFSQIISIPKFFKDKYIDYKFQSATIGYNKFKKGFIANLTFKTITPKTVENISNDRIVGVDRGMYNLVFLSDGFRYASNKIRKMRREMLFLKKQLQAKGTRSSKKKLKKLSGYEKRFSLQVNHVISKLLAKIPYDIFVLEDLSFKQENKGKKLNKKKSNWSFYQLEQFLKYKLEALGKQIVFIDPKYTSQKCSNCGKINKANRSGSHYGCNCGYKDHADKNAAINIKNNYISKLISTAEKQKVEQAVVNQPIVALAMIATSHQPCAGGN